MKRIRNGCCPARSLGIGHGDLKENKMGRGISGSRSFSHPASFSYLFKLPFPFIQQQTNKQTAVCGKQMGKKRRRNGKATFKTTNKKCVCVFLCQSHF
jgi:hypothetical protein